MRAIIGLAVVGLVLGCNRDKSSEGSPTDPNTQDRAGVTTLTGASVVSNESAIDRIVAARCAREVTCSNLGPDKRYTNGESCLREVRTKLHDEMKPSDCGRGINARELDECLDAIRNESCTNAIAVAGATVNETIGRLAQCRGGELCLK